MGTIADIFASVFRDYVTDGVPASGDNEPQKSEIRSIGPLIESALGAGVLGGVDVAYATRAALNGDLAHAAGSTALVYADSTAANNDLYVKTGASGSGAWTLTTTLHDAIGGLAQPYVTLAKNYANASTDADIAGAAPGERGAKFYANKAKDSADAAEATSTALKALYPNTLPARVVTLEGLISYATLAFSLVSYQQTQITSLQDALAAVRRGDVPAWMLAARVRNSGWQLEIDVADSHANGGIDWTKVALTSYDMGYDANAQLVVRPVVVRATRVLRKAYPDQNTRYQNIAGGISTWRLSLDRQMYAKAKAGTGNSGIDPVVDLAAGWYVDTVVAGASVVFYTAATMNASLAYAAGTVAALIGDGLYTKSGASGSGAWARTGNFPANSLAPTQAGLRAANNSTEAYPVLVARNALPPHRLLGATGVFELTGNGEGATEGRTFAAAKLTLTGVTSGVVREQVVAQMVASTTYAKRTCASPVYRASVDMTAFTQGEEVSERWRVYPFIGDAAVIFDTDANTYLSGQQSTFRHIVNHAGTYAKVYAFVNPTTGNDGTGAASTVSEAAAKAAPFATERAAVKAAYYANVGLGRNNQSGIEIVFADGFDHVLTSIKTQFGDPPTFFASEDIPVGGTWLVYRPETGASACNLKRNTAIANVSPPRRSCFRGFGKFDLVKVTSGNPIALDGGETSTGSYGQQIWLDNTPLWDGNDTTNTAIGLYQCGMVYLTNTAHQTGSSAAWAYGNTRQEIMLVRDCDFGTVRAMPNPWAWVGVSCVLAANGTSIGPTSAALTNRILPNSGTILAGVQIRSAVTGNSTFSYTGQGSDVVLGHAMLNVLIEGYGTTQPMLHVFGDGSNFRVKGFWLDYLTIVGGRINIGYEDSFTMTDDGDPEQQLKKLMVVRRSIIRESNTKTDLFQNVAARVHTWNVAFHTGWKYVRRIEADSAGGTAPGVGTWSGEAWPATETYVGPDARAQFVDYKADHRTPTVVGVGGGNYMPAAGSVFLNVIPANDEACAVDLYGNARNGAVGAIERAA